MKDKSNFYKYIINFMRGIFLSFSTGLLQKLETRFHDFSITKTWCFFSLFTINLIKAICIVIDKRVPPSKYSHWTYPLCNNVNKHFKVTIFVLHTSTAKKCARVSEMGNIPWQLHDFFSLWKVNFLWPRMKWKISMTFDDSFNEFRKFSMTVQTLS